MKKVVLLLVALSSVFAMTQKPKVLFIKGEVGVYGSMPHSFLAIKDQNNTLYKIKNYKEFNLSKAQNQIVEAKIFLIKKHKRFKNVLEGELLELKVLQ